MCACSVYQLNQRVELSPNSVHSAGEPLRLESEKPRDKKQATAAELASAAPPLREDADPGRLRLNAQGRFDSRAN